MIRYKATRGADGHLTVFQVPIFVECKRGDKAYDSAWIAEAVKNARQSEVEGYYAPLHVRHHGGDPTMVKPAGFFRVTGTGSITFKGEQRQAIFADLVITDPTIGEDVLAARLPYRSVEIFSIDRPAIDSLALLDHQAPYLELPMLMVAEVVDTPHRIAAAADVASATFANPWLRASAENREPVVACFRHGQSAHLLFGDDEDMTKTTTATKFAADAPKADEKKADAPKGDAKKDGEKMAEGGLDVASIVAAIEDGTISIADMDAIEAAVKSRRAAVAPAETEDPNAPAPAAAPGEAMAKDTMSAEMAKMHGKLAAQEARLNEREATDKRREDVAAALKRLEGRPLGADLETKLVAFHRTYGPEAFGAYVTSMAETFGALPASNDRAANAFGGSPSDTPAVAMSYQDQGADAVGKAARFAREWLDLHERGAVRTDEARYVALNMQRAGFKVPTPKA